MLILCLAIFIGLIIFILFRIHTLSSDEFEKNNYESSSLKYAPEVYQHKNDEQRLETSSTNNISLTVTTTSDTVEYPPLHIRDVSSWDKYHEYKVKGKNPETNRFKTCVVVAKEGTPENEITLKSGFNEPFTITLGDRSPSERQLNLVKDINITVPPNCTLHDVSCLISRRYGEIGDSWIPYDLYKFVSDNGFQISPYTDICGGVCAAFHMLNSHDSLAFFAYLVYCVINDLEIGNIYDSSCESIFYEFADTYINNEKILDLLSFEGEQIEHLLSKKRFDGRNKKKAWIFDLAFNFLSENIKT